MSGFVSLLVAEPPPQSNNFQALNRLEVALDCFWWNIRVKGTELKCATFFRFLCVKKGFNLKSWHCIRSKRCDYFCKTNLCPGVIWFSTAGALEEVKTLVSESCMDKETHSVYYIYI